MKSLLQQTAQQKTLEEDNSDFQSLTVGWHMTSKWALSKLKLNKPPPAGQEKDQHLFSVWEQEELYRFKYFLRCFNNQGIVPK